MEMPSGDGSGDEVAPWFLVALSLIGALFLGGWAKGMKEGTTKGLQVITAPVIGFVMMLVGGMMLFEWGHVFIGVVNACAVIGIFVAFQKAMTGSTDEES